VRNHNFPWVGEELEVYTATQNAGKTADAVSTADEAAGPA